MRALVVGHGIQGRKRRAVAGSEAVGIVDPVHPEADWKRIEDVPIDRYDAALVCTPDDPKVELLTHLLGHGKHVLVEKPLFAEKEEDIVRLGEIAKRNRAVVYTAYNHRFEPHFVRMKDAISSGALGDIYLLRMFYGNGTARDVRNSIWRDKGAGVLPDLGSHLIDTVLFWLGGLPGKLEITAANRFENRAFDHVALIARGRPAVELEMTLLSWRNHFTCDVYGEKGSAHIVCLCKWGPSSFTIRKRVLPSGRPSEDGVTLTQADPTWAEEYAHFKRLCAEGGGGIERDLVINREIARLSREALAC
ncbi:MAG: Gfo/Idh/MocA family oxidoreductase [Alphaproteobacteria bacterium]|nr:Gfo/Idh/MocA family oxidoreductase [Alphaproteobacteria bacterium]